MERPFLQCPGSACVFGPRPLERIPSSCFHFCPSFGHPGILNSFLLLNLHLGRWPSLSGE